MKTRNTFVHFSELEIIFDELGIKTKRYEFCGVSDRQYLNWKKKGKVPADKFWALQKELTVFFQKKMIKKLVILGIIEKEFLEELIDLIEERL